LQAAADHQVNLLQSQVEDLQRQLKKRLEEVDELSSSTSAMQLVSSEASSVFVDGSKLAYMPLSG
jgi:hypothetical protein